MDEAKLKIQGKIDEAMKNRDTNYSFVCKSDIEQLWHFDDDIRVIFPTTPTWTEHELAKIRENFILTISILVYINWPETQDFRSRFFHFNEGGKQRTDNQLPYPIKNDLSFLGGCQSMFFDMQWRFKPVIIEQHRKAHLQVVNPLARLPFVEEKKRIIGCGGFGKVHKVRVAPNYLEREGGYINPRVSPHSSGMVMF
jgi:hypothetical protein